MKTKLKVIQLYGFKGKVETQRISFWSKVINGDVE